MSHWPTIRLWFLHRDPTVTTVFQTFSRRQFRRQRRCANAITSARQRRRRDQAAKTVMAKFDGEFANRSQTYAGLGTVRYTVVAVQIGTPARRLEIGVPVRYPVSLSRTQIGLFLLGGISTAAGERYPSQQ
jgi:hypothetical protein